LHRLAITFSFVIKPNEKQLISEPEKTDRYYQALLDRDPTFLGTFYVGVKTTAIFCLPTCRARKPKRENVEFFSTVKEALAHGYRSCKVCKPTENASQPPPEVEKALQLLQEQPCRKLRDYDLRTENLSPENIRRWFLRHYGITFQAYQRMNRINQAYQELQNGGKPTTTAFEAGYESLSGFGYTFKKLIGRSPAQTDQKTILLIQRFTTPLGPMFVCASEQGVCLLEFTDRRMLETEFRDLQQRLNAEILVGENQHSQKAIREIGEYFAGTRRQFTIPLHTPATVFQLRVWELLQAIPYGETSNYQNQALILGNPNAIRAVARANGMNRVAIVIPCHRVIGKDGSLVGYAGGLERKRWLLDFEKENAK
jgi:AraC family transcriptional regulator of adaptative response/methylated-DNA-[protein]-cysteine methyltransferase